MGVLPRIRVAAVYRSPLSIVGTVLTGVARLMADVQSQVETYESIWLISNSINDMRWKCVGRSFGKEDVPESSCASVAETPLSGLCKADTFMSQVDPMIEGAHTIAWGYEMSLAGFWRQETVLER